MENEKTKKRSAGDEALRTQLQIEWQDHFQTRTQSWKTIQISGTLVLGLIGANIKFNNIWISTILGIILIITSLSGMAVTIRHWKIQIDIFGRIHKIQELLGLHQSVGGEFHKPGKYRFSDFLNPKVTYVPIFIIRIHAVISIFAIFYVTARWLKPEWFLSL